MTIFREYGPFKGVHNSTSNLAQKQGYVLDSENMLVNQDNGDIQKRPGVIEKDVLTECIGIARHIVERSNGDDNLFIVGTKNKIKDTIASLPISASDFLGAGTFPAKVAGDSFSSFLYGGNLYYNYGDFIYKWDNRRVGRAGRKYLKMDDNRGVSAPTPGRAFKFLIQTCDANNDVAELSETDLLDTNAFDGAHQFVNYYMTVKDDVTGCELFYNAPYFLVDSTRAPFSVNSVFNDATGTDFTVPASSVANIAVGDFVLILSRQPVPYDGLTVDDTLNWRRFEVKSIVSSPAGSRSVTFKNPLKLEVIIFAANANFLARSDIVSNVVIYPYFKAASDSVYREYKFFNRDYFCTYSGHCILPNSVDSGGGTAELPNYGTVTTSVGLPYESPVYARSSLPRCKHISQLDALMFMSCPRPFSQPGATVAEEFEYQTLAWSSENPEDPIETWGGMSAIIGTEEEGRIYATVPNNGNIVIFKERAIHFSDIPINGVIQPVKVMGSSVGCKDPQSIQECNGLLLFYVSGKGVYAYRAGMAQAQELTMGFRGMFKTITGIVNSTHDVKNSKYVLSIGTKTFIYDYLIDSWWIWTGFNADCGLEYFQEKVVGVNASFHLFDLEQGVLHDTVLSALGVPSNVAISAFIVPNWFTGFDVEMDKKLKALRIWALNGSGAQHVDVYKNFRDVTDYDFTIENSSNVIDIADFARSESGKRKFKAITFKISNAIIDQDLKVTGWAIDYEPTGVESKNFEGAR